MDQKQVVRIALGMPSHSLYGVGLEALGGRSLMERLAKAESIGLVGTNRLLAPGQKIPFWDFHRLKDLKECNTTHGACIDATTFAAVGMGFRPTKAETMKERQQKLQAEMALMGERMQGEASLMSLMKAAVDASSDPTLRTELDKQLDPLTNRTFLAVLTDAIRDRRETNNGYLEITRDKGSDDIIGIHYLPAECTFVFLEDQGRARHYVIIGEHEQMHWPMFGDYANFKTRTKTDPFTGRTTYSEVIHFNGNLRKDNVYGTVEWLAAVPHIELSMSHIQAGFDFYDHKGIPETLLFITGHEIHKDDWLRIQACFNEEVSPITARRNTRRGVFNISDDVKINMVRLAAENAFASDTHLAVEQAQAYAIAQAHRVPHLLIGLVTSGKAGAANEVSSSILMFQALVMGPMQKEITTTLITTLGDDERNGALNIPEEAWALNRISDLFDPEQLDTLARMRTPAPEAAAEGRQIGEGIRPGSNARTNAPNGLPR